MQDQPADMPVAAVFGVFEPESALQPELAVVAPSQAHPAGMDGLVQPLHPRRLAGIAADLLGALGSGSSRAP